MEKQSVLECGMLGRMTLSPQSHYARGVHQIEYRACTSLDYMILTSKQAKRLARMRKGL